MAYLYWNQNILLAWPLSFNQGISSASISNNRLMGLQHPMGSVPRLITGPVFMKQISLSYNMGKLLHEYGTRSRVCPLLTQSHYTDVGGSTMLQQFEYFKLQSWWLCRSMIHLVKQAHFIHYYTTLLFCTEGAIQNRVFWSGESLSRRGYHVIVCIMFYTSIYIYSIEHATRGIFLSKKTKLCSIEPLSFYGLI